MALKEQIAKTKGISDKFSGWVFLLVDNALTRLLEQVMSAHAFALASAHSASVKSHA
jgi:hypothetical protein